MGPFVLYDEVGLDVAQHVGETMGRALPEHRTRSDVVDRLVAVGRTGRKSGGGFLDWTRPKMPLLWRLAFGLGGKSRAYAGIVYDLLGNPPRRNFPTKVIQDRLVLTFVNEAIRCLGEGVLQSPTDGDLGAVLGLGFPPFLGGPFHFADDQGVPALRSSLERLAERYGPRFEPARRLLEMEKAGATFYGSQWGAGVEIRQVGDRPPALR